MKLFKIYEMLWLVIAIFAVLTIIYQLATKDGLDNKDYILLFIGAIALMMYFFKRRNRRFFEKSE